jgi:hypothetical protein
LAATIKQHYTFSKDWDSQLYCSIKIKWDYPNCTVDLSMPGYIAATLHKYQHPTTKCSQHAPHQWNQLICGAKQQMTEPADKTAPSTLDGIKCIQQITVTHLYYARVVDPTMLVALDFIATEQSNGKEAKAEAIVQQLLDYCATHPESTIHYRASGMILGIHIDASYLSKAKAQSRMEGHFILTTKHPTTPKRAIGPCSPPPLPCAMSCHLRQKLNVELYSTTPRIESPFRLPLNKRDILNPPHQFKSTIPQ